jgi:tol-pal system protein YbgF
MAQMRDEISRVQADRDRFEQRVNQLELQAAEARDARKQDKPAEPGPAQAPQTPKLRIVHLAPGQQPEGPTDPPAPTSAPEEDDNAPRPTIRVVGTPGRGRMPDRIEQTNPEEPQPPKAGRPSALDPEARRAYDAALALVQSGKHAQALDAFAAFLVRWPDHPYADNATYWRGEAYYAQGEFMRAAEQFEGVLARFPSGNKAPDALLKLGMCSVKLGNPQKARSLFERLLKEHPRSDAAKRIPQENR